MSDDRSINSEVSSQMDELETDLGMVGWTVDWTDQEGVRLVNKKLKVAIVLSENEVNISKAIDE